MTTKERAVQIAEVLVTHALQGDPGEQLTALALATGRMMDLTGAHEDLVHRMVGIGASSSAAARLCAGRTRGQG